MVDEVVDDTPRVRLLRDDDPGQPVHSKQHVRHSRIADAALGHKPEVIGARRESFPVDQPYQRGQPLVPVGQLLGGHSLTKQPGQPAVGGRSERRRSGSVQYLRPHGLALSRGQPAGAVRLLVETFDRRQQAVPARSELSVSAATFMPSPAHGGEQPDQRLTAVRSVRSRQPPPPTTRPAPRA